MNLQRLTSKLKKWLVPILIGASFFLSLGYSLYHQIEPVVDADAYDAIALNLLEGYGFRENSEKSFEYDTAMLRAGPGYEFFLVALYQIFGHNYMVVWIAQAFLHAGSAYLIFLCARRIWPSERRTVGLVALALYGFSPDLIEISAMLMTETLYLFCTILTLYIFIRSYEKPNNWKWALVLGVVTGGAILTRPPLLLFVPIFIFFYLYKRSYQALGSFLIGFGSALAPWIIRNYHVYHTFILTTLIGEYNIWIGNTLASNGGQIASGFNPVTTYVDSHGISGLSEEAKKQFFSFVFTHPFIFLKLTLIRIIRYFSMIRPMGFWFYQTGIQQMLFVTFSGIWIATIFIGGIAAMWHMWRVHKDMLSKYLIVLAATAPLLLIVTVVQSRYRFQVYPFLILYTAWIFVHLKEDKRAKKIFLSVCGIVGAISIIDMSFYWSTIVERISTFL